MIGEAKALVSDYALLAVLDARRASVRLAWLLGTVLIASVLIVTAWLALGIAAAINLAGAAALAWWMRSLATEMPFNALVRSLRGEAPTQP